MRQTSAQTWVWSPKRLHRMTYRDTAGIVRSCKWTRRSSCRHLRKRTAQHVRWQQTTRGSARAVDGNEDSRDEMVYAAFVLHPQSNAHESLTCGAPCPPSFSERNMGVVSVETESFHTSGCHLLLICSRFMIIDRIWSAPSQPQQRKRQTKRKAGSECAHLI